jgi:hypothetical protein
MATESLSLQGSDGGDWLVGKEIAVKKYVVRLSAEERAQLDELISKGKRSACEGPHPAEGGRIGVR